MQNSEKKLYVQKNYTRNPDRSTCENGKCLESVISHSLISAMESQKLQKLIQKKLFQQVLMQKS